MNSVGLVGGGILAGKRNYAVGYQPARTGKFDLGPHQFLGRSAGLRQA